MEFIGDARTPELIIREVAIVRRDREIFFMNYSVSHKDEV
jgi:hypothetical protein